MLTRYPERFGALFCTIPLIDMRRYTKLLAGASWIAEYGDPDKAEDWDFIRHFSAYHMAASAGALPPHPDRDDAAG
jgi:prolyl oligopeptidase